MAQQGRKVEELLKARKVLLNNMIDDDLAALIIAQLLFLEDMDSTSPIELWVRSPGGVTSASLAVIDSMKSLSAPVHTRCVGKVAGTAALIVTCGTPGARLMSKGSTLQLCNPTVEGPDGVQRDDWEASRHEEMRLLRERLVEIVVVASGRSVGEVSRAFDQGRVFDAKAAWSFGLVDGMTLETGP